MNFGASTPDTYVTEWSIIVLCMLFCLFLVTNKQRR
jgi:hypothetical protein